MSQFLGLRTAGYKVSDITRAKEWYADVLGIQPYFDEPFYVGFNVGGYELGPATSRDRSRQTWLGQHGLLGRKRCTSHV
jgi:catechol 2,3-dioxygenase-like lactoylglutathione lyase family enzyme